MDTASSTPVNVDAPIPLMTKADAPADPGHLPTVPAVAMPVPPAPERSAKKGGWGALIGIILIVGLIVTAAFYSWGERLEMQQPQEAQ